MNFPNFVGPSYVSQSPIADGERCMNLYVERLESSGAKAEYALYPTPGLAAFASCPESPVRGAFQQNGRCFVVVGDALREVFVNGTTTRLGTVAIDDNPVTMSANGDNGDELFIVSGGSGYILTLSTNVLTAVVTGATMGAFLDGYFLALDAMTSTLKISGLVDGLTWDPTQIAQRTAGADPWRSMRVVHREIWLFGEQTAEPWYNAGVFPFPFAPIPGAFMEQGIGAPWSPARVGSSLLWLGRNEQGAGIVLRGGGGYQPERISTHAVEFAIQGYLRAGLRIDDAEGWSYQDQGHIFYVLAFPEANATWVFDAATNQNFWHERGTWQSVNHAYETWRPRCHAYAFGLHLVGDRRSGTIWRQGIDLYTDADGGELRRLRRLPILSGQRKRIFFSRLEIDMETGLSMTLPPVPSVDTWITRTTPADREWRAVAWAPELGLFAAVASSGTGTRVMTSSDGITWTLRDTPADNNWYGLAWSPALRLFVAVASSGVGNRVMTSPDGITWTIGVSAADNNWTAVAWSPDLNLFAAVASSGTLNRIMTSPDGITWTTRTTPNSLYTGIAWSPQLGLFAAVANSGPISTSPDGITWTSRTSPAANAWTSVAWSPEAAIFAAVAYTGTGNRVMTSTDGLTWTIGVSAADNQWYAIVWASALRLFVAVAYTGTADRVMTSPDGITWTTRSGLEDLAWWGLAWAPALQIFAAVNNSGTGTRAATSTLQPVVRDPQVMLHWSDDAGRTWSNEHWASAGLVGEYRRRAVWRRLGTARDRVFEVVVTDPIPLRIVGATVDAQAGQS